MKDLVLTSACALTFMLATGCASGPQQQDKVAVARELAAAKVASTSATAQPSPESESEPEPKPLEVQAGRFDPNYTSINARVLAEASVVDSRFATSLDPRFETVTRLESSWTQQRENSDEIWRLGDAVSSAGLWGSTVRFGGLQFGTRSDVRQDVIASPRLASSGIAVLPSVADALFASAGAAHPELKGQNLSVGRIKIAGPNAVNFVARDSMGRAQTITAPLVADTPLTSSSASGCDDFSVGLGRVRRDYAIVSNDYGPLFANTTVVCGAPLGLTVEGHGEYLSDELTALGIGLSRRIGVLGTASLAVASSQASVGSGWLARFGFDHENSLFNVMVRTRTQSREFREVATVAVSDPIMERGIASLGMNMSDTSSLALTYATQTTWERERVHLVGLSQSLRLGSTSLSMSAGHSLVAADGSSVFISFTRPFGFYVPRRISVIETIQPMLDRTLQQ